jgi:hypothetical protein
MNEEIKKDRSPRAPVTTLTKAVELVRKLYSEIGRGKVDPQTASKAMGYTGLTGATLTIFAGLNQYQLINREQGKILVSPLAVRILHPTSIEQKVQSLKEAALAPEVFKELSSYPEASEHILISHLVQKTFAPERAKHVARVFLANKPYIKPEGSGISEERPESEPDEQLEISLPVETPKISISNSAPSSPQVDPPHSNGVLARYSIPLGENEVTIVFTGKSLSPEDFDALIEYVGLFKKQFERRQAKDIRQTATETPGATPIP